MKCVNCGGHHYPGQSNCPVVQRLRTEKRQLQHQSKSTYSYAAATSRPQGSLTTSRSSTLAVPSDLHVQLSTINKKLDEVKQSFLELNTKLSDKVSQLEDRLTEVEERLIYSRRKLVTRRKILESNISLP